MGMEFEKALTWEISNFSESWKVFMPSNPFSSGGCNWRVTIYPKGYRGCDDLCMYLQDADPKSLRTGWKRRVYYYFVLLNQSDKELYRSIGEDKCKLFCAEVSSWGVHTTLTLNRLQEEGFLENDKLIIQVYIKTVEVVHQGKSTENDMFKFEGLYNLFSMDKILDHQPDFAVDLKPKNQAVKTAYMNLLLGLIKTLNKSPQSLFGTELSNAQSELNDLTQAGFKLDWLKSKLEEISAERKKALSDGSWVQQLEERVSNIEFALSDIKAELHKEKIESIGAAKKRFFSRLITRFLELLSVSVQRF